MKLHRDLGISQPTAWFMLQRIREAFRMDVLPETDDAKAYKGIPNHESVKHSVSEYVNGQAHTNGVESFWAVLKRAYHGVYHHMSPKHLDRYVAQFAGKHNVRGMDTADQMAHVVASMVGKRLLWRELVA